MFKYKDALKPQTSLISPSKLLIFLLYSAGALLLHVQMFRIVFSLVIESLKILISYFRDKIHAIEISVEARKNTQIIYFLLINVAKSRLF